MSSTCSAPSAARRCSATRGIAQALHLDPCPLCIFQRIGVAVAGVLFLLARCSIHAALGARVYGVLIVAALLATVAVAARHLWVQHLPPGTVPSCGAPLPICCKFCRSPT